MSETYLLQKAGNKRPYKTVNTFTDRKQAQRAFDVLPVQGRQKKRLVYNDPEAAVLPRHVMCRLNAQGLTINGDL